MGRASGTPKGVSQVHLTVPREEAERQIRLQYVRGSELYNRAVANLPDMAQLEKDFRLWYDFTFQMLGGLLSESEGQVEFARRLQPMFHAGGLRTVGTRLLDVRHVLAFRLERLESLALRLPLWADTPAATTHAHENKARITQTDSRTVFVVHGHDDGARAKVVTFLDRMGLDPVILHEKANKGRTIIEKVEAHSDVAFAVVLLTPDDVGGTSATALVKRARQNVILELGFFMGLLGRERVAALYRGDLQLPSDFDGVLYIPFDADDKWQDGLARELKEAGLNCDPEARA